MFTRNVRYYLTNFFQLVSLSKENITATTKVTHTTTTATTTTATTTKTTTTTTTTTTSSWPRSVDILKFVLLEQNQIRSFSSHNRYNACVRC